MCITVYIHFDSKFFSCFSPLSTMYHFLFVGSSFALAATNLESVILLKIRLLFRMFVPHSVLFVSRSFCLSCKMTHLLDGTHNHIATVPN